MNSKLRAKKNIALLLACTLAIFSFSTAHANDDEHGLWTSFDMSKKITKRFKVGTEFEFRTSDYLKEVERFSAGISGQYKLTSWLKANAGYIFIAGYNPKSMSIKEDVEWIDFNTGEEGVETNYNIDHSYWEKRNRVYFALSGEYKIGRVELSLRERVQFTRTNSETIDEEKHRFNGTLGEKPTKEIEHNREHKDSKKNTVLRSRLTAKWDVPKCKVNPFVSAELYTRLDYWKGFDKMRSRIGASYKINKDNAIEFYYLFEKAGEKGAPDTHAIGIGYSLDL